MKKLFILLVVMGIFSAVSAAGPQFRGYVKGGYYRPHTVIVRGYYDPFYSPYYGWGFGLRYPYYMYPYGYEPAPRPSKLDQEIADLEHDYSQKISSVRMDKSLNGKDRRAHIRALRAERKEAIDKARMDYYKK